MKKKNLIRLNTIDLGGGTTKGCDCEAPDLSAYAKKHDVPTKVSQLENDSEFVKSTSLGTAAYKNIEDLQGGDGKWNLLQTISLSGSAQSFFIISNMGEDLYTDGLLVVVNSSQDLTFNFGYGANQIKGKVIEVERLNAYPEDGSPASMIASYLIKGDNSGVIEVVHPGFGGQTINVSTSNGDELSGMIRLFYKKISNLKS